MKKYPYREIFEVDEAEGIYNFYWQLLCGDLQTDNIMGCGSYQTLVYKSGKKEGLEYQKRVGIGPKKAEKILEECDSELSMFQAVWEAYYDNIVKPDEEGAIQYKDVFKVDEAVLENGRLLWMIRELTPEGEPVHWEFPE